MLLQTDATMFVDVMPKHSLLQLRPNAGYPCYVSLLRREYWYHDITKDL